MKCRDGGIMKCSLSLPLQWRIQSWSHGGFPSHKFKGLLKVGASKGVIRVDFK